MEELNNRQKRRLLEQAILDLPTDRYDYAISVLEEKYEELEQSSMSEALPLGSSDSESSPSEAERKPCPVCGKKDCVNSGGVGIVEV